MSSVRLGILSAVVLSGVIASDVRAQQLVTAPSVITSPSVSTAVSAPANSYYCPKCGTYHAYKNASSVSPASYTSSTSLSASGGVTNVLAALNAQRARNGVSSLSFDPALQAVAERRAQQMAASGMKSHPPGSFSPGRYEGVGWSSSYSPSGVSACYTNDGSMRVAGAAMATGRDGVYFCVVYR